MAQSVTAFVNAVLVQRHSDVGFWAHVDLGSSVMIHDSCSRELVEVHHVRNQSSGRTEQFGMRARFSRAL